MLYEKGHKPRSIKTGYRLYEKGHKPRSIKTGYRLYVSYLTQVKRQGKGNGKVVTRFNKDRVYTTTPVSKAGKVNRRI